MDVLSSKADQERCLTHGFVRWTIKKLERNLRRQAVDQQTANLLAIGLNFLPNTFPWREPCAEFHPEISVANDRRAYMTRNALR